MGGARAAAFALLACALWSPSSARAFAAPAAPCASTSPAGLPSPARAGSRAPAQAMDPFRAKLVSNAASAKKTASTFGAIAKKAAPKGLTAAQRKEYAAQSRWLVGVAARFSALRARMEAVLKKSGASTAEIAQVSMALVALRDEARAEAARTPVSSKPAQRRHDAALRALASE